MHACVYSIYYNNHHSNTGRTNLNVKNDRGTDNLYSYIIKININFIKSILYLTYNIPYNCGKKVKKLFMKKNYFQYRCEQRLFKLDKPSNCSVNGSETDLRKIPDYCRR